MNSERIVFIFGLIFGAAGVILFSVLSNVINPKTIYIKIINSSEDPIDRALVETDRRIYGSIGNDFSIESDNTFKINTAEPIIYKTTVIFTDGKVITHTSPTVKAGWVVYEYIENGAIRTHIRSK